MEFTLELKNRINYIEREMKNFLPEEVGYQKTIFEAMNYSLNAGGKRLRPILIMEAYRACGGLGEDFLPYSVAVEMIHTYSLIHDDLPALDNDDLRRGKPTNHRVFGEDMAILAGDALLNHAFETMLAYAKDSDRPDLHIRAMYEIARGAGIYGMIGGQVVDVQSEGKAIKKDELDFIHINKTAKMIIASVRCGAILAKASDENLQALTRYAENIGLAFQIVDDILDIEGDEKTLGKKVGSDIDNMKSTYPSLLGMKESKKIASDLIEEAKRSIGIFDNSDVEFLISLSEFILNRSN